jgi:hypothetical protein
VLHWLMISTVGEDKPSARSANPHFDFPFISIN